LGPFSIDLGASSLGHVRAVRMASGHARALAAELALTVGVGVWGNHGPTMVHWEESTHPVSVNLRTGLVLPVLDSATGLALAAHLPRALSRSHIEQELEAQRGQTSLRSWNDVECALAAVQQQGVARTLTDEAFTAMYGSQVNAVSAPVFGPDGMVALALTVLGRACEAPPDWHERVSVPLKRTADALSATLGAPPARADRQA
jgi:DNA-binding IclR family transcriptional regulator